MVKKADKQLIKILNEKSILKLVRDQGPISIVEISNKTQMSKVAVYDIINRLIKEGLVVETGKAESTSRGGKKPLLIKLNTDERFVIGVLFKRKEAFIALANIESNILNTESLRFKVGAEIKEVIPKIFAKIDSILKRKSIKVDQLISISIGIPGLINYQKGQLKFAHTLGGWGNKPIAELFSQKYQVPISLENDVKLISMAEYFIGAGKNHSETVCIWIGEGIGSGIIHEGKLLRGIQSSAGEIGYMELGAICNKCKYLNSGQKYYGDILSEEFLISTIKSNLEKEKRVPEVILPDITLESIFNMANQNDKLICEILDEYSYILSTICDSFVKTLNPGLIILNGNIIQISDYILNKVRSILDEKMKEIPITGTQIIKGELHENVGIMGTIIMALETLFEPNFAINKSNNFSQ